jgi:hypothetical protein
MGWNTGNEIFEPVAWAVASTRMDSEAAIRILEILIGTLQDRDWDTEDESLEVFKDNQVVVEAFERCGITLRDEDD